MNPAPDQEFFSVLIPTRNRPEALARAIASVARQAYANMELLVVDDGSSLACDEVLADCGIAVHYLRNPRALGVSAARNRGIAAARGRWILFLDDDDEFETGYFSRVNEAIRRLDASVGFLWSNVRIANYEGDRFAGYTFKRYRPHYRTRKSLTCDAATIGASYGLVVRKAALEAAGGFDERFRIGEDTELLIRLMAHGYLPCAIPVIGVSKHQHNRPRLSLNANPYSDAHVCENIADLHEAFLSENIEMYVDLLAWGVRNHYTAQNFSAGDRLRARLLGLWTKRPLRTARVWLALTRHRAGVLERARDAGPSPG